jgi:predicted Ser/Thr protein kinase
MRASRYLRALLAADITAIPVRLLQGLWAFVVVATVAYTVVYLGAFVNYVYTGPVVREFVRISPDLIALCMLVVESLWLVSFMAVAGYMAYKRWTNPVVLLASAVGFMVPGRVAYMQIVPPEYLPAWFPPFLQTAYLGLFGLLAYIVFAIFPDGTYAPRWMRWWVLVRFLIMFNYVFNVVPPLNRVYVWIDILMFGALFLGQYRRYRTVQSVIVRQQTKWVLLGMSIALKFFFLKRLSDVYVPAPQVYALIHVASRLAVLSLPLVFGFALLRYRLYDVDWVLNRGLVYAGLTFSLVLAATGTILVAEWLLILLGVPVAPLPVFMMAAACVVLLYRPVAARAQRFVDRRLFRLRSDLNELALRQQPRRVYDDQWSGLELGAMTVGRLLGKGGMGRVYEARMGQRRVAVKLLPADGADDQPSRFAFEREMAILAGLKHPNICEMIVSGVSNNMPYIALEYLEGEDLSDHLRHHQHMPLDQIVLILRDVAAALDYLHAQGIIHRDVKPGNILLQDMRAVVMDFGLAGYVQSSDERDSGVFGTLEYIAPEQLLADTALTTRVDVYSLGVLAYRLFTGRTPFAGTIGQVVFGHLYAPPSDPRLFNPAIGAQTAFALLKALAKNPAERYATASEFVRDMV